ncbi:MAG: 2Fe-2S iron-sulfur cluster-binding protein [Carboxydocellales bacterium]
MPLVVPPLTAGQYPRAFKSHQNRVEFCHQRGIFCLSRVCSSCSSSISNVRRLRSCSSYFAPGLNINGPAVCNSCYVGVLLLPYFCIVSHSDLPPISVIKGRPGY